VIVAVRKPPVIVWLRRDLRIKDNPALQAAAVSGQPVVVVYIYESGQSWAPGGATRWWLHHSLTDLANSLKSLGNRLRVFSGDAKDILQSVVDETGADTVLWNRRYEPDCIDCDAHIKKQLTTDGLTVNSYPGNYCHEPWQVCREGKHPYRVFTAYWRASLKHESIELTAEIEKLPGRRGSLADEVSIDWLGLLPTINWDRHFKDNWTPGESNAQALLDQLLKDKINDYDSGRDLPSIDGTSRLSPHLAFGEISPRQINAAIRAGLQNGSLMDDENTETYLREIGWRDFANHLLYHFPATTTEPLDSRFGKFPWRKIKPAELKRWQQGNTGIPLVDAGMRQLWQTGWMHNRVRMVVGSLLIKNLGYHWKEGAHWFWDTLVDADLASNTMGWQWVAGSGADAAPYFRVFNPVRQGERFDKDGDYVKHWVPEIAKLPKKYIHAPWTAPADVLDTAGIKLGETYPAPIVDLAESRKEALARFDKIKQPAT
jgi:deoxyribodipyrimidine photo-lyase